VVSIGEGAQARFEPISEEIAEITVTGTRSIIDTTSVEASTNVTAEQLERMPIQRNVTAIQLLAPDAGRGSNDFTTQQGQDLVSFGGAAALENAYTLNGFNITDFRRGLGGSEVPFEFIQQTSVKTGGYSAEYGRSLGGVVNMVSKTGTNDFKFGGNVIWEPNFGRADQPDYSIDGERYIINDADQRDSTEANVFASGPIIKDRLFFYGLVGLKNTINDNTGIGGATKSHAKTDTPPYYAMNLAANIAEGHRLEFTMFSDERDQTTLIKPQSGNYTEYVAKLEETTGGQNYVLNYNGQITDWFAISALAGHGKLKDESSVSAANGGDCSILTDKLDGSGQAIGCSPGTSFVGNTTDTRDAYRLDGTFSFDFVGSHELKVGYDLERLETKLNQQYPGDSTAYEYSTCSDDPDDDTDTNCGLNGGSVEFGTTYVKERTVRQTGTFKNNLSAYYVQDNWQVTPRLQVQLGVRNDTFDLKGKQDFIKLDNQWAPRLGVAFDTFGNGRSKVYASFGRYYMPIETNTAVRNLYTGLDQTSFFTYDSIGPDGYPINPVQVGSTSGQISDGAIPAYDKHLRPTSQDEFRLGYTMQVAPLWSAGVVGTYRKLKEAIEDTCYFNQDLAYGCVILNPGHDAEVNGQDYDFDGVPDFITIRNSDLHLPKPIRRYYALEFDLERVYDGKWFMKASYTWSHLFGNFEGYSNSNTGQADPGISSVFDNQYLVSYGDLPNDHRHNIKLYGGYSFTEEWAVGVNLSAVSGRPKNAYGLIPNGTPGFYEGNDAINQSIIDAYNDGYEGEFRFVNNKPSGRGAEGRLDWILDLDVSLSYAPKYVPGLKVSAAVFNVFNWDSITNIDEAKETISQPNSPTYGSPRYSDSFQAPRTLQLSARYEFGI